jgi:predicted chitinase
METAEKFDVFPGIVNENEFYSHHFFAHVFQSRIKGKRPAKYIFRRPRRIRTMVPCSTPGGRATWHDDDGPQSTGEGLSRAGRPAA